MPVWWASILLAGQAGQGPAALLSLPLGACTGTGAPSTSKWALRVSTNKPWA